MLVTFALTVGILLLVVAGASIGVIFKRKPIQGSCGGLDALGIAKACSCKEPCSQAKEKQARAEFLARQGQYQKPQVDTNSNYAQDRTGEGSYSAK